MSDDNNDSSTPSPQQLERGVANAVTSIPFWDHEEEIDTNTSVMGSNELETTLSSAIITEDDFDIGELPEEISESVLQQILVKLNPAVQSKVHEPVAAFIRKIEVERSEILDSCFGSFPIILEQPL